MRAIDQARQAKAEGDQRRVAQVREAQKVEQTEEERLRQIANERLDLDYDKWVEKIIAGAGGGLATVRCAPFDDLGDRDFSEIMRHHGTWEVWESKRRGGYNQYSDLQYAYLNALADRLVEDGFRVDHHPRVEEVTDYGTVYYCQVHVSGW
jgi:hypothetical protein